jgi:hypothetical protein
MSLIIVKGSYKKGQIFCQTNSYKKEQREYHLKGKQSEKG